MGNIQKREPEGKMPSKILIVAGEASADCHAAALVRELKGKLPGVLFYGVGGDELEKEGVEIIVPSRTLGIVGITDWTDKIWSALSAFRKVSKTIKTEQPDCAILLDLPDFNLMLAKKISKKGIPVIYYVSPQIWAWRKRRIRKIKKYVEKMLVIFPFEAKIYEENRVNVVFVGHPFIDRVKPKNNNIRSGLDILQNPRVALLPGSRKSEVENHAQIFSDLAKKLISRYPSAQFKIPVATTLDWDWVEQKLFFLKGALTKEDALSVYQWADMVVVASGTATLEAALVGVPMCILYRVSRISNLVFKAFVKYRGFVGMPNLLSGRKIVEEFLQENATLENLFLESVRMIEDAEYRSKMVFNLSECRKHLGQNGASVRAANEVLKTVKLKMADR